MKKLFYILCTLSISFNTFAHLDIFERKLIEEVIRTKNQKKTFEKNLERTAICFATLFALSLLSSYFIADKTIKKNVFKQVDTLAKLTLGAFMLDRTCKWYLSAEITSKEETLAKIRTFKEASDSNDIVAFFEFTQKE